ncbi:phosphonate ABC transporter ATP-binding protein [Agarivorans sp. DSG3-1]|uniref:phosphonate ABC transporter ATP-binding protein n=1 Tax=Agarivorans sp. DSG3-1 TaxID=3342249 RepID=UPI00398EAB9B
MSNYAEPSSLASAGVSAASSLLQVSGLSKSFDNSNTPIFSDVSFSISASQSVALIGSNGAGKSTLLRCCLRLIEPDSGSIVLDGETIDKKSGRHLSKVRNKVGFVFQKHCLVPRLSALTNVIHGNLAYSQGPRNWLHSLAKQEVRDRAMDCLEQVGLAHLAGKRCDQLSGGQSQRVAVARALMQQPTILFADEPTASLDPQSGQEIMELFERLVKDKGLTLFFVSHNIEHALKYADRVLGLQARKLSLDSATNTQSLQSLRAFYG